MWGYVWWSSRKGGWVFRGPNSYLNTLDLTYTEKLSSVIMRKGNIYDCHGLNDNYYLNNLSGGTGSYNIFGSGGTWLWPMLPTSLPRSYQLRYSSVVGSDLLMGIPLPTGLKKRSAGLDSLRRYWRRVPAWWPVPDHISCSWPLCLYAKSIKKAGQPNIFKDIVYMCKYIYSKAKSVDTDYQDDFFRKFLKGVHNIAYQNVFSNGPVWLLFMHLHQLTGRAPYDNEDIKNDISSWVSYKKQDIMENQFRNYLNINRTNWRIKSSHLKFDEYSRDIIRYGSSGGGPASVFDGKKMRTKWAWLLSCIQDEKGRYKPKDVYKEALNCEKSCTVALKEEPAKTREIIATPMSSYIRQCYLLYRWGKPTISSPISRSNWLYEFEKQKYRWYGTLDGEHFDWSISKNTVIIFIRFLGTLDSDTKWVADQEIDHLNSLEVIYGDDIWKWEGGLLSGWRITSILGSLVSDCVARYIQQHLQRDMFNGVLGDDLILYSNVVTATRSELVKLYNDFGLSANMGKTVSGPRGEFLKRMISEGGFWSYPALGLKSVVYANPWLEKYNFDDETALSSSWLTLYSRLLPHSTKVDSLTKYFKKCITRDLNGRFGSNNWDDWLVTPISAGGGGPNEWSEPHRWVTLKKIRDADVVNTKDIIPFLLGALRPSKIIIKRVKMIKVTYDKIEKTKDDLTSFVGLERGFSWLNDVNITKSIYCFLHSSMSRLELQRCLLFPLPSGVRNQSRRDIVSFLLMNVKGYNGVCSITHTKDGQGVFLRVTEFLTKLLASRKSKKLTDIKPAVCVMANYMLRNVKHAYGTW
uniref:RNA-directed RNA polymerase n=1 Tax=Xiangshan toli-like virus TaxID=2886239 RepID=A0A8K1YQL8_9VIRU|nr:MAG: RNA dependent RNA polymerase [Xiangshan toli-like virus]